MPGQFLHGVELVELTTGTRPIQTVKSSVIGCVLTADSEIDPTLIITEADVTALSVAGADVEALHWIRKQTGTMIVAVGTVDETTAVTAIQKLISAKANLGVEPRIILAPTLSETAAVASELVTVAERLHAVALIDAPVDSTTNEVITFRDTFGSERANVCYPYVKATNSTGTVVEAPLSPFMAGLIAKRDNENGFWWSPSNQIINGCIGMKHAIDFKLGDTNCTANLLNENEIFTVIQENGYRLWGNRTCATEPAYNFLSVVRTKDMINDSLQRAHLWAVDRNISKNFITEVVEGVRAYLRTLEALGAILGGDCWANSELNAPEQLQAGKVTFDFDFTPPTPAEHITFRSHLTNIYFSEVN